MKKKISKSVLMTALITGLCIGGVQSAFAAENLNTFALDEYVVTATRTLKELQEVPASVSVVTAKDIEERNVTSVRDAIQYLPGVYIDQAAQGSIQMRGFGGTDILVLVDGQQMNTGYNGTTELNSIAVESIERIEVLRGAASSIYGGHAVGGVINITTKEANKVGTHGSAVVSYGSNDTWKKSLQVNSKVNDKWSFGLGYEHSESDGYQGYYVTKSAKDSYYDAANANISGLKKLSNGYYLVGERGEKKWERENYNFNVKYNFDANKSLKYMFTKTDYEHKYNPGRSYVKDSNGNTILTGNVNVTGSKGIALSARDYLGTDNYLERDTHTLVYKDDENKFMTSFSFVDNKVDGFVSPTSRANLDGSEMVKDLTWTGEGDYSSHPSKVYDFNIEKAWENVGKHNIVVGANIKQEEMLQDRFTVTNWHNKNSKIDHYAQDDGEVKNMALFVQDEYKISEPLTMYLGARLDYYKKGDGKFFSTQTGASYNEKSDSESYTELSPKIAFDYKADDKTNYYVSYGHSFNPPEIYKIYRYSEFTNYWYVPNPDLDPETSDTFEIGMKKKVSDNTDLGITFYHVDTDDKIAASAENKVDKFNGKNTKKYMNYNKEERNGVEFELNHKFSDKYSAYVNYAWQQGKLEEKGKAEKNNYEIPKHILHAGIQYNCDKWNALLDCEYVGEREDPSKDLSGISSQEAYFLVNTAINYEIAKDMTLQFAVNNLFDKEFYADEATAGRTYGVSLRYSF